MALSWLLFGTIVSVAVFSLVLFQLQFGTFLFHKSCLDSFFCSFNLVLTVVPDVPGPDNLKHQTILFAYFSLSKGAR